MAKPRVVWSETEQRFVPVRGSARSGRPKAQQAPPKAPALGDTQIAPRPRASATAAPARQRPPSRRPVAPAPDAPAAAPSRRPRRRRRWWIRIPVVVLLVLALLFAGGLAFAWMQFNRIDRVDVAAALSPAGGGGTNYLIVGSDSREGIEADDPNSAAFIGQEVSGARTDTIMVLRVEADQTLLMSIPRDLWVQNAATGEFGRINSTFQSGPETLIRSVQQSLGIPIHHYLEIDFLSFGSLVDAVGGITVDFENPARDENSGLLVEAAGPVELNGEQALAYVRSRNYTEFVNGVWQTDPTADIGRTERQRVFLTELMGRVGAARSPISLSRVAGAVGGGLRIDDTISFFDALSLGWDLKGLAPQSVELPVYGRTTSGGAAVLELDAGSDEVLAAFQ